MFLRQIMVSLALILLIVQPVATIAKDEMPNGLVDDSIRDMSIVFGTGAAGAVLGLSTLSFVDEPSKHMKNIAVGGAVGVVIGVAAVIFYQASKTTISQNQNLLPMSADQFASASRKEFVESHHEVTLPNQNKALRILLPF
jgi:ABC-type Fe3+ transport system permease subunit